VLLTRPLSLVGLCESAIAPPGAAAAAQLDHFLLRKKLGLEQCSQKTPPRPTEQKHGSIDSQSPTTDSALLLRVSPDGFFALKICSMVGGSG